MAVDTKKTTIAVLGFLIPVFFFFLPINVGLSNVILLLILVGFVITFNRDYFKRDSWSWPAIWLIALFAVVLVGVTYSPAPWSWVSINLSKYAKFVYAVALILLLMRFPKWQNRAMLGFVAAMFFVLISTWLNIWFVLPWSVTKTPGWGMSHHVFGDYITQNIMMSFFVVFALSKIQRPWVGRVAVFWAIVALLGAVSITHLSSGRTGVLLLIIGLASFVFVHFGDKKSWVILPVMTALIIGVLLSSTLMRDRIALGWSEFSKRDVDVMSSIGHRSYNYKTVPQMIAERPLIGHGTGAYHTEICRFLDHYDWCDTFRWHPHNQYLFFGADHGLLGIFLYLMLLASLYRMALLGDDVNIKIWLITFVNILAINGMINTPLFSSIESHFFLYMMALLVAKSDRRTSAKVLKLHNS